MPSCLFHRCQFDEAPGQEPVGGPRQRARQGEPDAAPKNADPVRATYNICIRFVCVCSSNVWGRCPGSGCFSLASFSEGYLHYTSTFRQGLRLVLSLKEGRARADVATSQVQLLLG